MNLEIAKRAIEALSDPHFDQKRNHCQIFVREVIQSLYGNKYDNVGGVQVFYLETARKTGWAWLNTPYGKTPDNTPNFPEPGDLLYKTVGAGHDGHTGIFVGDVPGHGMNLVAENSYYPGPKIQGYKGFRTLSQFGAVQVAVRLPTAHTPIRIYLNDREIGEGVLANGHVLFPVTAWAEILGFTADYSDVDQRVTFTDRNGNTSHPAESVTLIGGYGYLPIRSLAENSGLTVASFTDTTVTITKP